MNAGRTRSPIEPTLAETSFVWLRRLLAVYCLFLGIAYWVRLIGIHDGELWRFDLMPDTWKAAVTALAVLFPVAATGLWILAPWGPVIWILAAAMESSIYTIFSSTFGYRPMVAAVHITFVVAYVALRLAIFLQKRRSERLARVSDR